MEGEVEVPQGGFMADMVVAESKTMAVCWLEMFPWTAGNRHM